MKTIDVLLAEHPFFNGMAPGYIEFIAGCGRNVQFEPGSYVRREGQEANEFYAIREGTVAVEVFVPGRGPVILQTLSLRSVTQPHDALTRHLPLHCRMLLVEPTEGSPSPYLLTITTTVMTPARTAASMMAMANSPLPCVSCPPVPGIERI